jgi:hypothetical protein
MKNSGPQSARRDKMEDDNSDDFDPSGEEVFDVLFGNDENGDDNAIATLQWLEWKFSVVPREDGDGRSLVYGIPDFLMN